LVGTLDLNGPSKIIRSALGAIVHLQPPASTDENGTVIP
jgi:hypothetical protein